MKVAYLYLSIFVWLMSCGQGSSNLNESHEKTTGQSKIDSAEMDHSIPLLSFEDLEDGYINRKRENVLVLNFWATWCKPCVKELPAFEQLGAEFKDKGVEVVLVSLDFPEHVEKAVLPFIEKNNLQSEVVLLEDPDANTWIPKVSNQWSGAIPATLIISEGQRYFYEQSFTYESLKNQVQPLLNK